MFIRKWEEEGIFLESQNSKISYEWQWITPNLMAAIVSSWSEVVCRWNDVLIRGERETVGTEILLSGRKGGRDSSQCPTDGLADVEIENDISLTETVK